MSIEWMWAGGLGLAALLAMSAYWDYRDRLRRAYLAGARYGARQGMQCILRNLGSYADKHGGGVHPEVEAVFQQMDNLSMRSGDFGDYVIKLNPHFINQHVREEVANIDATQEDGKTRELELYFGLLKQLGDALGKACSERAAFVVKSQMLDSR